MTRDTLHDIAWPVSIWYGLTQIAYAVRHSNAMQESDLWHTAWHCLAGSTRADTIPSNDTPVRWVLAVPCRKVTRDTLHVTVTTCQRSKNAGRWADTVIDGGGNMYEGNTTPQGLNYVVKAWLTICYTSQLSLVRCFQVSTACNYLSCIIYSFTCIHFEWYTYSMSRNFYFF